MSRLNNLLVALLGISLLVVALAALLPRVGVAADEKDKGPRKYFLTKTEHKGNEALSACAAGHHMASLWEIFDPSNLRYNTELGFTHAFPDSGFGPPTSATGWIRTGFASSFGGTAPGSVGEANCNAWTSAEEEHFGTTAELPAKWYTDSGLINKTTPWSGVEIRCDVHERVWCVQD